MKKREFLKTGSILVTGSIISSGMACSSSKPVTNWAGNLTFSTRNIHYPTTVSQVQETVKRLKSVRGLGSKHSFNTIADSPANLLSLRDMKKVVGIAPENRTITVEAGVRYGDVCAAIREAGFGLHNLASLPHISIAGACATATHGSGVANGALAVGVSGLELVKANGDLVRLTREKDGDLFNGVVVGLGAVGIVTKVTLDLLPDYDMQQVVYLNLPMAALENNFTEIMSSGYSVSLFTDWRNGNVSEVWIKSRVDAKEIISSPTYYDAKLADRNLHPIESNPAENCTEQMGVAGPWYERLPHFKMGFTPSSGEELQAEYFVPMESGFQAMAAIEKLADKIHPHLFISEIRTIAADDYWMSPFYKKPCVAIHFTFKPHGPEVRQLLPQIEAALDPFGVRPHWGKLFAMAPGVLQGRIKRLEDFRELVREFDPEGKLRNDFLERNLF